MTSGDASHWPAANTAAATWPPPPHPPPGGQIVLAPPLHEVNLDTATQRWAYMVWARDFCSNIKARFVSLTWNETRFNIWGKIYKIDYYVQEYTRCHTNIYGMCASTGNLILICNHTMIELPIYDKCRFFFFYKCPYGMSDDACRSGRIPKTVDIIIMWWACNSSPGTQRDDKGGREARQSTADSINQLHEQTRINP